jgi:AcrR family transcriptional regulator
MPSKRADEPTTGRRLNRDRVVTVAVQLADESGLEAVSMRTLADRLGVKAMSLYNHVRNKDDLVDAMVDAVYAEIDLPNADGWRGAMRERARSARAALRRHPWAIPLMESRTGPGPANLRHHDTVLGVLRAAGLSLHAATFAYSVIDSYVYGFALQEASLPFTTPEEMAAVAAAMVVHLPADQYPHLRAAVVELPASGYRYADEFDAGLDLVLDGLEQRLPLDPSVE